MKVTILLNERFKEKIESDIEKAKAEKLNEIGIHSIDDYFKLFKFKVKLANPKFESISIKFTREPIISFMGKNYLNTGLIIGENKVQIAYLFISSLFLNSRNIFGAQQIFPSLSDLVAHFIETPMYELVNLPVYFVNGSVDNITESMKANIVSIYLMGIHYVQMFNESFNSEAIGKNDLKGYIKYISDKKDEVLESIDTDFFKVNFCNKKIVFKKKTLKEDNNMGSSDRFFVIKAYPALMLAYDENYEIDISEIQQFLDSHAMGKSNLLPFLEYAEKLKAKIDMKDETQLVYYGAPGTGKSYCVDKIIRKKVDETQIFRTTFYSEYSYEDFTGQLLPIVKKDIITYEFQPGVFTNALKRAYMDLAKPVYLIIEEMSRGNVASVFGDIFQLLDRNSIGVSRYPIRNSIIANEIAQVDSDIIKLPSNFHIIGTVNISDQNVTPMDTAFKRRFDWRYVSVMPVKNEKGIDIEEDNVLLNLKIGESNDEVRWHEFYLKLDKFITDRNNGLGLSEDKQIGQFFIKFSTKMSSDTIAEKVQNKLMQFLWYDVEEAAYANNVKLFKDEISSYSDLSRELKRDKQVFSEAFIVYYNSIELEEQHL